MDALVWLKKNGAATERESPYTGVKGKCKTELGKNGPKSSGYKQTVTPCLKGDCKTSLKYELDLMLAVKEKGPFMVYTDASRWQNYVSADTRTQTAAASAHARVPVGRSARCSCFLFCFLLFFFLGRRHLPSRAVQQQQRGRQSRRAAARLRTQQRSGRQPRAGCHEVVGRAMLGRREN